MNEINIMGLINIPIVAICFILGYVIKNYIKKIPNKYIPLIMLGVGSVTGITMSLMSNDMDIMHSIISGAVSGLASTGAYEFIVNTFGLKVNKDMSTNEDIEEDVDSE